MKIKADFVTNSSSTAYVMHMPKAFVIPVELMEKIVENIHTDFDEELETQALVEMAYTVVEDLKNGEKIYSEDYDNDNSSMRHNIAWSIMNEFGLKIDSIELGGGGGMDVIIPIIDSDVENASKKGMELLAEKIKELKDSTKSIGKAT